MLKGGFDEVVKESIGSLDDEIFEVPKLMGTRAIHMASPCLISDVEPEKDLLVPATEGTKNILLSISAHTPRVNMLSQHCVFRSHCQMQK
ncbi:hypothetical protein GJ744_007053 [Endocarpon pusillum]|uniref:Uncharacterized protein n=1 Tax=Endocarpon pusillum TaxID=364733 RepID=A0A8H7AMK8_9EURO|nr:hypothetical protein GJ744_007053 [Endocarpon pusillum]